MPAQEGPTRGSMMHASPREAAMDDGDSRRKAPVAVAACCCDRHRCCTKTSCKRWLFRLSNIMAVSFFFLMAITVSILTSVMFDLTRNNVSVARAAHDIMKLSTELEQNQRSRIAYQTSATFASLLDSKKLLWSGENIVNVACNILEKTDRRYVLRSFALGSLMYNMIVACTHADANLTSLRTMTACVLTNSTASPMYFVDPETHNFATPLEVYMVPRPGQENMTAFFDNLRDPESFPTIGALYDVRDGLIDEIPPKLYWSRPASLPSIVTFTYPFFTYGTKQDREYGVTDAVTYVESRLEARRFAHSIHCTAAKTTSKLMAVAPFSLTSGDPVVWSNNWGQEVNSDPSAFTVTYSADNFTLLHVSEIDEPHMQEAVKRIDFEALVEEEASQNFTFTFGGNTVIVTAWRYSTDLGLEAVFVLVTPMELISSPVLIMYSIAGGAVAACVAVFTVLFWVFVEFHMSRPLHRMAVVMNDSAQSRRRVVLRKRVGLGPRCLRLTEIETIMATYNRAMAQIAEIDKYVRPDILTAMQMRMASSSLNVSTTLDRLLSSRTSPMLSGASHDNASTMPNYHNAPLYVTSVTCFVYQTRYSGGGSRRTGGAAGTANAHASVPHTVQCVLSAMDLEAYLDELYRLADMHGGYVQSVNPGLCILYFCRHMLSLGEALRAHPYADGAWVERSVARAAAGDALAGAEFAVEMGRFWDRQRARRGLARPYPFTTATVDTQLSVCTVAQRTDGSRSLLLNSRCVSNDLGPVLPLLGSQVVMCEETVLLVQERVRALPMEAVEVGTPSGRVAYGVVLYEALPGPVEDAAWRDYRACFYAAFANMLHGRYRDALDCFDGAAATPCVDVGLLPREERGTHARAAPDAPHSAQIDRLYAECVDRVMCGDTTPYVRRPLSLEFLHMLRRPLRALLSDGVRGGAECGSDDDTTTCEERSTTRDSSRHGASGSSRSESGSTGSLDVDSAGAGGGAAAAAAPSAAGGEGPLEAERPQTQRCEDDRVPREEGRSISVYRETTADGEELVIPYTTYASIRDSRGQDWSVGSQCLGSHQDIEYNHKYLVLAENGTLAVAQFYLLRSQAVAPDAVPTSASDCQKSTRVLALAPVLFPELPNNEYIVAYIGYCSGLLGGFAAITEYFPGGNLRETMLRYGRRLPSAVTARYMASILGGLQFLQDKGIVHGDVCPENLLVGTDGRGKLRGYFGDYALARTLLVLRASSYVSPEVAGGGAATFASDVYCAGLVLVEMLTTACPWRWNSVLALDHTPDELHAVVSECGAAFRGGVARGDIVPALPLPPDVCEEAENAHLVSVVDGALRADPSARLTATELLQLLSSC